MCLLSPPFIVYHYFCGFFFCHFSPFHFFSFPRAFAFWSTCFPLKTCFCVPQDSGNLLLFVPAEWTPNEGTQSSEHWLLLLLLEEVQGMLLLLPFLLLELLLELSLELEGALAVEVSMPNTASVVAVLLFSRTAFFGIDEDRTWHYHYLRGDALFRKGDVAGGTAAAR